MADIELSEEEKREALRLYAPEKTRRRSDDALLALAKHVERQRIEMRKILAERQAQAEKERKKNER